MTLNDKEQLEKIKKRMQELAEQINLWDYQYYELDFPSVSDAQYDLTYQELVALEEQYPQLISTNSPTKKVGSKSASNKFSKFKHLKPMLSLAKAYSLDDVKKFISDGLKNTQQKGLTYSLEPKIDGLSISLHYQEGQLIRAVTRGDGVEGEIVTENIRQIKNLPQQINYQKSIEIRGEVFLSKSDYLKANQRLLLEHDLKNNLKTIEEIAAQIQKNNPYKEKLESFITKQEKQDFENLSALENWVNEGKSLINQNNFVSVKPINTPLKLFANPRNAASGTLRQLNEKIVKQRNLSYFVYEIVSPEEHHISTQIQALEFLKNNNFSVNHYTYHAKDENDVINQIELFKDIKPNLDYDCDGFVIKINEMQYWNKLGFTAKFPRYAIAFKYETEEAITKVIGITAEVGRTGKITYVAKLSPVQLNQTTVSNATLHNYQFIQDLNLNVNDEVKVIKSGEIIPKVISVVNKNSNDIFPKVLHCPSCNSLLKQFNNLVDQFCINDQCPEKEIRKIIHFASRDALNIVDLGEENIKLFYQNNLVKNILDIYKLKDQTQALLKLPKIGQKKVLKLIASIEKSKNTTLAKAIFGIGIKGIGISLAELLTDKIQKLMDLTQINLDDLVQINTVGETLIQNIKDFISSEDNVNLLYRLDQILNYQTRNTTNKLANLNFVITGTLSKSRDYFKELIIQNGAKVSSSISKNTSYLLAGAEAGSKLEKAQKIGVQVLSEEEFWEMIK